MNTHNETILILGATGKTGRRVAERLRAHQRSVRIGSRSGARDFVRDAAAAGAWQS